MAASGASGPMRAALLLMGRGSGPGRRGSCCRARGCAGFLPSTFSGVGIIMHIQPPPKPKCPQPQGSISLHTCSLCLSTIAA